MAIIKDNVPILFKAMNFIEGENQMLPMPAFIEIRDVLSHIKDLATDIDDPEKVKKNIIEIKQHFRRGIVETYQELFDTKMAFHYQYYYKYKYKIMQFEKLLLLNRKNREKHRRINEKEKKAKTLWIEARNLKNNEVSNPLFNESIEKFKLACETINETEDDINAIWNDYIKRLYILGIATLVGIIALLSAL